MDADPRLERAQVLLDELGDELRRLCAAPSSGPGVPGAQRAALVRHLKAMLWELESSWLASARPPGSEAERRWNALRAAVQRYRELASDPAEPR